MLVGEDEEFDDGYGDGEDDSKEEVLSNWGSEVAQASQTLPDIEALNGFLIFKFVFDTLLIILGF